MENVISLKGFEEFERALLNSPQLVKSAAGNYLQRGKAVLLRKMLESPWRMGSSGGGIPKDQGQLRQAHRSQVDMNALTATILADSQAAPYAAAVHGIEGSARKRTYQLRPWMDYAVEQEQKTIDGMQNDLLKEIVKDLAD